MVAKPLKQSSNKQKTYKKHVLRKSQKSKFTFFVKLPKVFFTFEESHTKTMFNNFGSFHTFFFSRDFIFSIVWGRMQGVIYIIWVTPTSDTRVMTPGWLHPVNTLGQASPRWPVALGAIVPWCHRGAMADDAWPGVARLVAVRGTVTQRIVAMSLAPRKPLRQVSRNVLRTESGEYKYV